MSNEQTARTLITSGIAENISTARSLLKSVDRWDDQHIDNFIAEVTGAKMSPAVEVEVEPKTSVLMQSALGAVSRGWYVFALKERGKEPDAQFSPHGFNSSTNDPAVVRQIWTAKPNANCGIDLGRSNLTVLDYDNGRPPAGLLPTLQVSTSRGTHVYYSGTTKQGKIKSGDVVLGDIKSGGGYVLAPGCIHPSGAVYSTVLNAPIAPVPSLDSLRGASESQPTNVSLDGPKIPRGSHDNELTKMARKLRGVMGLDEQDIYDHLVKLVETRFENYGTDYLEMCQKHAKSVMKFEPNPQGTLLQMGQALAVVPPQEEKPLVVVDGDQFLVEKIPPRKVLVQTISSGEPVIFEQSINQIFAWRGVGKTCLGLGFVRAIATGGHFLNFRCPERAHVLYIEGELPDSQMQERWKAIVGQTDGYAHLATIDKQPGHTFQSLASDEGMQRVETALTALQSAGMQVKVLMLDNISTLFNIGANDEEVWIGIQSWLTSLRSRGLTVFYFHHAGKGGASRSHSKSEDMLDVSIKLEAPDDQEQGHLHAVMTFDKARAGLSEKPAEIKLLRSHSDNCQCLGVTVLFCPGDGTKWEYKPIRNNRLEAEKLFALGRSIPEVYRELGEPEGTVKRWRTEWGKKNAGKPMTAPKP